MKSCTRKVFGAVFVLKVPRMVKSVVLTPIKSSSKLADLASDTNLRIAYHKFELPPARQAGVKVKDVPELVTRLKNEAKVI